MKLLVDAGLVRAQKRGRWVLYSIDATAFAGVVDWLAPFAEAKATCGVAA
jgi:DNA-binding transcriptional ArsR family regulator